MKIILFGISDVRVQIDILGFLISSLVLRSKVVQYILVLCIAYKFHRDERLSETNPSPF